MPSLPLGHVIYDLSQSITKPAKLSVHPVKTHISLGIHLVCTETLLCPLWVVKDPNLLQIDSYETVQKLRLVWIFAGHTSVSWFCLAPAYMVFRPCQYNIENLFFKFLQFVSSSVYQLLMEMSQNHCLPDTRLSVSLKYMKTIEPHHEKTCLREFVIRYDTSRSA